LTDARAARLRVDEEQPLTPLERRRRMRAVDPVAPTAPGERFARGRDAADSVAELQVATSPPQRRTIVITGQATTPRSRPAPVRGSRKRTRAGSQPDRLALWAVALGLFLAAVAAATADASSGGASAGGASGPGAAEASQGQGKAAEYRHGVFGGRSLQAGDAGTDVKTLQRLLGVAVDGHFGEATAKAVRRLQRRRGLEADGKVGPATRRALAKRWNVRTATYYGPGLYGNRTACGQKLSHGLRGVAHKKLPCGTRVPVYYAGRISILPVVDRGPFVKGVTFDITEGAAKALGMRSTVRIRARY